MGDDLADYIADNYGHCKLESCYCILPTHGFIGRHCLNWVPTSAKDWGELRAVQLSLRNSTDTP
jgi:hypothetical protein